MNIDSRRKGLYIYGIWQLKATTTTRWQVTGKKIQKKLKKIKFKNNSNPEIKIGAQMGPK
jgi:hypothetical protein